MKDYPENRLDIIIDENGNMSFERNPEFDKYYMPDKDELIDELKRKEYELEMLQIDEPDDLYGDEHDDWEESVSNLEDEINLLRARINTTNP